MNLKNFSAPILVDTSIWIEILKGNVQIEAEEFLKLSTCLPVIQEVFQGLVNTESSDVFKSRFLNLKCLSKNLNINNFIQAADIFHLGRSKGYTIRSSYDCLIAQIAIENKCTVWHKDRDFTHIEKFTALKSFS